MKTKRLKCPVCGTRNWSGTEFCEKCSGDLYGYKESNNMSLGLKLLKIFN